MTKRPLTDAERRYAAAKGTLDAAELDIAAAEKIISKYPGKIERLKRRKRDLKNSVYHGTADQNSRANRSDKLLDLECDLAKIEEELKHTQEKRQTLQKTAETARKAESEAAAAFSIEADRARLDAEAQRTEIALRGHDLAERKFAHAEEAAKSTALVKVEEARAAGESSERIAQLEVQAKAAILKFEFQQRREMQAFDAEVRANEIELTNEGSLEMARTQGEIAERAANLNHSQALEVISANQMADIGRIVSTEDEKRKSVTHQTNEDIRKAAEIMELALKKGQSDTLNAMKLLVLKSYLKRSEMREAHKIATEARAQGLTSIADDMAEIERWSEAQDSLKTDFDDEDN